MKVYVDTYEYWPFYSIDTDKAWRTEIEVTDAEKAFIDVTQNNFELAQRLIESRLLKSQSKLTLRQGMDGTYEIISESVEA